MSSCGVLVILAAMSAVQGLPAGQLFFSPRFPGTATGSSSGTVTSGETQTQFGGLSTITSQQAQTGGTAEGPGAINFGNAFTNTQRQQGLLGNSNTADVGSSSVQNTNPFGNTGFFTQNPFSQFGGLLGGTATGSANSQLNKGETIGPDGSRTTITQLGSSASGTSSGGSSSFNQAIGSTSSGSGLLGSQENTNLNAQSVQQGGR